MFREECKVVKQVYANGDFFIFGIAPLDYDNTQLKLNKYGSATIKGELGFLTEGKTYTFDLEEGKTDNYGTSYIVKDVPSMQMEDLSKLSYEDKMDILMECTTSERLAKNILSQYPDFIELILTQGKEAIDVKKIKGVGEAYLNAYSRNLISKYKYYGLCHDSRLKEYELGISEAKALFGMWNTRDDIVNAINRNPYYALIEVCERSYLKADKTILSIRDDLRESKQRTEALIIHILKQNENDGSTRLDGTTLFKIVKYDEDLKAPELATYLKDVAVESDYIYFDEKSGDLSVMATYLAECAVASFIIEKNKNCEPLDIDIEKYRVYNGLEVTDEQFQAIKNFRDNRFMLVTGYAGCGKTTVVQSMIGMCDDLGLTYTLIAPTGSASMRLSEQTHRYASTAHLKCLKDGEIRTDVLIIDECSMASLDIFKMVIDCITNDNIRVILIGDNAQLTSISCGTVFADIIESGYVPNAKLTKVFRYGDSGILYSATNERQGRYFLDDENVKFNGEDTYNILNNYKFIARAEDETIIDTALIQYNKLLTKYKPKDILILTGYNVGACGTITINNKIQSEVNPPKPNEEVLEKRFRGVKMLFRVGDRIINIKNNYNALPLDAYREIQNSNGMLSSDDFDLDTVYNGQRGVVIGIENGHIICKFDNQEIVYDKLETNTYLLLAYAITIHKSQGQESKAVITLYSPNQKRVMNRNLLYVGDTRAKELQIDVGDLTTFKSALGVDEVLARNTWTKDLLVSYYENN